MDAIIPYLFVYLQSPNRYIIIILATACQAVTYPGVAQLVARLLWEDTPGPPHNFISGCSAAGSAPAWEKPPGQFHNFISGCCAVGSAPALGAGGPGFESPHSDHLWQKNRLKRRFFCVFCSAFSVWTIAVQRWFQGQKSGGHMSEDCHRNRQIPNPSLIGMTAVFFIADTTNS